MMTMKRGIAAAIATGLVFGLAACGSSGGGGHS